MTISGHKWYPPSRILKRGKYWWRKEKKIYGDEYRVIHWNVPLVTYWNRVPIALKFQWNMSFLHHKKGKFRGKGRW